MSGVTIASGLMWRRRFEAEGIVKACCCCCWSPLSCGEASSRTMVAYSRTGEVVDVRGWCGRGSNDDLVEEVPVTLVD